MFLYLGFQSDIVRQDLRSFEMQMRLEYFFCFGILLVLDYYSKGSN